MKLEGAAGSIWALTRSGFAGIFRNVFFWVAIGYSVLVVGIATAIIYVISQVGPEDPAAYAESIRSFLDRGFLQDVIGWQVVAVIIVVAIVGTRTVSRDRMLGGLEFILSKTIPPWGYIASRVLTPVLASLLLLFVPILVMVMLMFMLVDPMPSDRVPLLWGAVGSALVVSLVLGVLAAAVGAIVASPRKAVVIWLLVVVATMPLAAIADEFGADWYWFVGPMPLLNATTFTFMGTAFPGRHVIQGWGALAILVVASLGLMRWRIREVVR